MTRKAALVSGTIRAMLRGPYAESSSREISFPEIPAAILEKTIQYCYYKARYGGTAGAAQGRIPEFVIEPEIALELLMCSTYLDL